MAVLLQLELKLVERECSHKHFVTRAGSCRKLDCYYLGAKAAVTRSSTGTSLRPRPEFTHKRRGWMGGRRWPLTLFSTGSTSPLCPVAHSMLYCCD